LRDHQIGGEREYGRDADRILRGDRGDRARAVDAERRERLEVRLDAGAAARVAAGDGESGAQQIVRLVQREL
jgi:hypothetical protein